MAFVVLLSTKTNAQLAVWDFNNETLTANFIHPNITASEATQSGLTSTDSFFTCNDKAWSPRSWNQSTIIDSNNDYTEYTITANVGHTISVSGLTFTSRRSNKGPKNFSIRSSKDAFSTDLIVGNNSETCTTNGGNFSSAITINSGDSIHFRIYGYNASGSGNMRIDDVTIIGTTSPTSNDPIVSFETPSSTQLETDAKFNVLVPISFLNYTEDVTIHVTVDETSTAEVGDYNLITSSLTFTKNETKHISLDINNDADFDTETIVLNISVSSGTASTAIDKHTLTITDDDLPNIMISEIMYNSIGGDDEWIEIVNDSEINVDISDWTITYNGNTFTFPTTIINADEFITIAVGSNGDGTFNNEAPFIPDFNNITSASSNNEVKDIKDNNNLTNSSRTIALKNKSKTIIDEVTYDKNHINTTNGGGPSYEIINTKLNNTSTSVNWQASVNYGGSPKRASGATWIGSQSNDWDTTTNWLHSLKPKFTSDVIIPNTATNSPTASNPIAANTITFQSDTSLLFDVLTEGEIIYNREVSSNWHLITSPIHNETIENLIKTNNFATGTGDNIGIGIYNNDTTTAWEYQNNSSTARLENGMGVAVKLNTSSMTFKGKPHPATTNLIPISTGQRNDFNLIGNIHTAYLDSDLFLENISNESVLDEKTIWLWDNNKYITKNKIDPIKIAPTQGFFIKAKTDGNIKLNTTMLTHNDTKTFLRKSTKTFFELAIENDQNKSTTKVFYVEGKTKSFDNGYDSRMFEDTTENFAIYTELLDDNDGRKLAIQTLPNDNFELMTIPIGLIADANTEITFSIQDFHLPTGIELFLEDRKNNTFVNISKENHTLTLNNETQGVGRFYIHTKAAQLNINDISNSISNVSIYKSAKKEITIAGFQGNATITTHTISGKELIKTNIKSDGVSKISLPKLASGIYIIKLNSKLIHTTKKIILE